MRTRTILASLAVFFAGVALSLAQNPQMGTWKLNDAQSELTMGTGKNTMVVYAPAGDNVKVTVEGVDKDGRPTHNEWTGKFDGKDYPVTGDPNSDMRSYIVVDDHTLDLSTKKGGKVMVTGRIVVAKDGRSRKVRTKGVDANGKSILNTAVYDKQ